MGFIRNTFDKYKPLFDKGGKFEKLAPGFNAFDTLMFVPNHTTKYGAHIRDGVDLKRVMVTVIFALVPAMIFGMWNVGYQYFSQLGEAGTFLDYLLYGAFKFLPMVVVSYGVGLGIEFAFGIFRGHEINEGYLVSGLLIPLIMPIDLPLWMLGVSVAFAVLIGKEAFGGTGMNVLNPALVARAFAYFSYAPSMSGDKVWVADASTVDAISGETILGALASGQSEVGSVLDMFLGFVPGSVGETSVLMILIGAAFLLFTGVASWRIMLSSLLGGAAMGIIFNLVGTSYPENALLNFPWWQHLLVGGFAFAIVFMATDPVSGAQTNRGKWYYGFLIGFLGIMIRIINPAYPEGIMMSILLLNVFAPTIDHYVIQANIKKRKNRLKIV